MSKFNKIVAGICVATSVFGLTACGGSKVKISMSEDGYLIINDTKTDIKSGKDGTNGKSAYELFLEENSWYTGSEEEWLNDVASGKLATTQEHVLISYGRHYDADIVSGSATSSNGSLVLTDAILALNDEVVMPVTENSSWEISFRATVMPNGSGGGQILTSYANGSDGRIYIGVNGTNKVMFMGVCIGDTYANYCWDVPLTVLSEEHDYSIKFKDGLYLLSIDGSSEKTFTSLNINQANRTATNAQVASKEFTEKIKVVTGQEYFTFTHIGANSHKCNNKIKSLKIVTSCVYGYEKLAEHPLADKTVYYLGSSVTRGNGGNTDGTSFADITGGLTGNTFVKEAISGTNLAIVSGRSDSYVERLAKLDFSKKPDVLVVQLSTNDFTNGVAKGEISSSTQSKNLDPTTITGAIEYIVATAKEQYGDIKVVVYACPLNTAWHKYYEYGEYVNGTLKQLEEKWKGTVSVLDLYNADYIKVPSYMQSDNLHPQKESYSQVFTPEFIKLLYEIL